MDSAIPPWRRVFVHGFQTVLILAVIFVPVFGASAADGDLDPDWGAGGITLYGPSSTWNLGLGAALQCDGKVVATGHINGYAEGSELAVVRFTSDGSLDTTFASNGLFSLDFGLGRDAGHDVAIQADGKIIVVGKITLTDVPGSNGSNFIVLRLTKNGSLDPTFSADGYHHFQFGDHSNGRAVAIQDDGRIVAAGQTHSDTAMAVARLTAAGELDPTFDTDGMVMVDFTLGNDEAWDVAIQDDGRILVVGTASVAAGAVAAVVRLLSDGSLDSTFGLGSGGAAALDFGFYSEGRGIALQDDDRIVVAGLTDEQTSVAVGRLTTDGLLDPSFGGDGMVIRDFGGDRDEGWGVAVQLDQRIVVSGFVDPGGVDQAALMRFTPTGEVDADFGIGGATLLSCCSPANLSAVVVQPHDGKIVAAGTADEGSLEWRILVLRAIGDSTLIFASNFECGDTVGWGASVP